MLRRILGEFKERLGIELEIPGDPQKLRDEFPAWLQHAAAKGQVILILDALNQLVDADGAPDLVWLPPVVPENVRLLVSTLPGRSLDEARRHHWPEMSVRPLSVDERKKLIQEYLGHRAKKLSDGRCQRIAAAPQSANPLYLRVLLDELCVAADHEGLDVRIDYYLSAPGPAELYEKVIARWEDDYEGDSDLVGDALSLVWASRRGFSEAELLEALGDDNGPLPRARWSPLFLAMAGALVSRRGLLNFAHDFLRSAVREAYLPSEHHQQEAHLKLADYFEPKPASPRRTDELPWQLVEAKEWQRLKDLLVDRDFLIMACDRNEYEVESFWAQLESNSSIRMVETYRNEIEHPDFGRDRRYALRLSYLLSQRGYVTEAGRLTLKINKNIEGKPCSPQDLCDAITAGVQHAINMHKSGDLNGAMERLKNVEICAGCSNLAMRQQNSNASINCRKRSACRDLFWISSATCPGQLQNLRKRNRFPCSRVIWTLFLARFTIMQ